LSQFDFIRAGWPDVFDAAVRAANAARPDLHGEIEAMNVDNFVVRPRRRLVEKWRVADRWKELSSADLEELARELADPSSVSIVELRRRPSRHF